MLNYSLLFTNLQYIVRLLKRLLILFNAKLFTDLQYIVRLLKRLLILFNAKLFADLQYIVRLLKRLLTLFNAIRGLTVHCPFKMACFKERKQNFRPTLL